MFAATLVTSLVVAWISTQSISAFLNEKIDQKFPTILRSATARLDLWYSQRQLDIETFARSATVVENVGALAGRSSRRQLTREEMEQYLGYVLERFPQYETLFLLSETGERLLWVGPEVDLPPELTRRLASVTGAHVSDIHALPEGPVQVASAPVKSRRDTRIASLHAVVELNELEQVLDSDDLGGVGVYVVGKEGEVVVHSPDATPRERYDRALPETVAIAAEEYTHVDGEHVVGSAVPFARFGWTIVVEERYGHAFAPVVSLIRKILGINLAIVGLFSLIAYQIARSIVRPIQALSRGARRIAQGENDVVIPESRRDDEIADLTRTFNEMTARLHSNQVEMEQQGVKIEDANRRLIAQNQELQRVNEVFEQLSITDGLTKLHNHRFFQEHLPREIKRADRTGEPLALVLIDIDDFKKLNDRYGHAVGDAVLRKVAEVMNSEIREMDLLARYGGEEFALLASQTTLEGAVALAEKIRLAIATTRFPVVDVEGPQELTLTVSIGVATYRGEAKAFFNDADRALYAAKAAGKDCVHAASVS